MTSCWCSWPAGSAHCTHQKFSTTAASRPAAAVRSTRNGRRPGSSGRSTTGETAGASATPPDDRARAALPVRREPALSHHLGEQALLLLRRHVPEVGGEDPLVPVRAADRRRTVPVELVGRLARAGRAGGDRPLVRGVHV